MDIDYLIDRIEALIQTGKRVPLSNKVMVDEQECYALIDQMRAIIPEEIKAAKRVLKERDNILDEANESANHLVKQAEHDREMMIDERGLLDEAERQRDQIVNEANQEAFEIRHQAQNMYEESVAQTQEMREGANQYAMQVLQELDGLLDKHLSVVRNGLQNFAQQSQQYQQQMEDYQRQHRPQYAPTKAELAERAAKASNNGATQQRPAASRPATNTSQPSAPPSSPQPQSRPAPIAAPQSQQQQPRPTAPRPEERRPVAPAPSQAPPPQLPNRNPLTSTGPGRLNLMPSTPPLRPVPKPINRNEENDPLDDFDEPEVEERPAPRNPSGNPIRRDNPSSRPPF